MKNLKNRLRRKKRIRARISGTAERPRLSVYRSNSHIYAQLIDDVSGQTLVTTSTLAKSVDANGNKTEQAKKVGEALAKVCLEKGIENVVFDRNGFLYHGRVRALAESAREAGLKF